MVLDGRIDGRNGRTDDAKTICLRLRWRIKKVYHALSRDQKRNTGPTQAKHMPYLVEKIKTLCPIGYVVVIPWVVRFYVEIILEL